MLRRVHAALARPLLMQRIADGAPRPKTTMDGDDATTRQDKKVTDPVPDEADADELALTRAVLQALRGWMIDGQTVVITRDDRTREVRIDAFAPSAAPLASQATDPERHDVGHFDGSRLCPGPGPWFAVRHGRRRSRGMRP